MSPQFRLPLSRCTDRSDTWFYEDLITLREGIYDLYNDYKEANNMMLIRP